MTSTDDLLTPKIITSSSPYQNNAKLGSTLRILYTAFNSAYLRTLFSIWGQLQPWLFDFKT